MMHSYHKLFISCIIAGLISVSVVQALEPLSIKDYGQRGHIFTIKEHSLLEIIQDRLNVAEQSGEIKELREQFKRRVAEKVKTPNPVTNIQKTQNTRTFYFDPTYTQKEDIKDRQGNIIIKAGETVNPLSSLSWGEPLIFIDGDDVEQVDFAKKYQGMIVLTKGAPLELEELHKQKFYFDQGGILVDKFGINQIPAVVEQEGMRLKITEVKI